MPIELRAALCYDCCNGLLELHKLNIGHRDVKPCNFLVFKTLKPRVFYTAKLTDFGCARKFGEEIGSLLMTSTYIGSGGYKPPEAIDSSKEFINFKAHDIWSFCIMLLETLYGLEVQSREYN